MEHLRQAAGGHGTAEAMKAGAALKDAQRRLAETRLAKLDGSLISLPEIEALWSDLTATTKWLFMSVPDWVRGEWADLDPARLTALREFCQQKLREAALSGEQPPLPGAHNDDDDDDDLADAA